MAVNRAFDYSKWDHIDISDDESDCHPNIEKETWFRLKRRQREEKEQAQNERKAELKKGIEEGNKRMKELSDRNTIIEEEGGSMEGEDPTALTAEAKEIKAELVKKQQELESLERNKTWNWENMCHVAEERTIINKSAASEAKDTMARAALPPKLAAALGEKSVSNVPGPESQVQEVHSYADFVEQHDEVMENFSELRDMDATRDFLKERGEILFADHCQSYLLLSCLEDEMNGKHERMKLVARQSQLLSSITELAVTLRRPPQDVVSALFLRLNEKEHNDRFLSGVEDFITKVQKRAVEKRKEMAQEALVEESTGVELSKEERIGPGGLDPLDVFESLPKKMQQAFEAQDTPLLNAALLEMTDEQRRYHMKRCEDSGLWVPGKGGSTSVEENVEEDISDEVSPEAVGKDAALPQ